MLSYALAIAVAVSSLVLFSTAFLMSDIHRQDDFLWSAVGLIYALVLWFCARNITGAVLLGQASASILLVSYSWQTLKLRKALANPERAQEIGNFSLLQKINDLLSRKKSQPLTTTPTVTTPNPKVTESEIAIPDTASTEEVTPNPQPETPKVESDRPIQKPEETVLDPQSDRSSSESSSKSKTSIGDKSPTTNEIVTEVVTPQTSDAVSDTERSQVDSASSTSVDETKIAVDTVAKDKVVKASTSQPVETNTVTESEIAPQPETAISEVESAPTVPTVKEATPKAENLPETLLDKEQEIVEDNVTVTPPKARSQSTAEASQTSEEAMPVKPKTTDALDSLETVEVAEILEAIPEDISSRKDRDKTNIIEVKTTEINIISQEKKSEQDSD